MIKILLIVGFIVLLIVFAIIVQRAERADIPNWQGIVIHHTATEKGSLETIRKYHIKEKGWDDIGYHFLITKDGVIHSARPLEKIGAHAKGRNKTHIGIALVGNNNFGVDQIFALRLLCARLVDRFNIMSIERHHNNCPGDNLNVENIETYALWANYNKTILER